MSFSAPRGVCFLFCLLCLVLAVSTAGGHAAEAQATQLLANRDVCVLGAGAAGLSAAVFLKDRGYSVVVLDSQPIVGGQCDTLHFTPPSPGMPDWLDVGVQFFANTTSANAAGLGPWVLDSVSFTERFAGAGAAVGVDFTTDTTPNYAVDLSLGLSLGLQNSSGSSTPAFYAAYGRLQAILATYPWIDTASVPDPVPAELLVPFTQFIATHQLEPLVGPVFVPQLFAGGLGDFDRLTTLYALLNMAPTIQRIFSVPNSGFVVRGGCQTIYDGMRAYLGQSNVITNADVKLALRPLLLGSVALSGVVQPSPNEFPLPRPFLYTCDKLIVAYPQLTSNMADLGLDSRERAVFNNVRQRFYFTGELEIEGPLADVGAFNLLNLNVNPAAPIITPVLPAITQITRGYPYGPAQFKASSNADLSVAEMTQVVNEQLGRFPKSLLTKVKLVKLIRHDFQPHFTADKLGAAGQTYGALSELQGRRSTFYLGSLVRFPTTYMLWDYSLRFVSAHFPNRRA